MPEVAPALEGLRVPHPETQADTEGLFLELPAHEFLAIQALARHLTRASLVDEFELGLQAIMASLAARAGF